MPRPERTTGTKVASALVSHRFSVRDAMLAYVDVATRPTQEAGW